MKNLNKFILLATMLFQTIIILTFNTSILAANSLVYLKRNIPLFNIAIIATTFLVIMSFRKISEYEAKQSELNFIKSYINSVEDILSILRTERHDYICHIQSIQALLFLQEYDELTSYIEGLTKNYRTINQIIRVGNPILTAIINTKREVAQEKGISFIIECKHMFGSIRLTSWELSSLFSNLIENAIEATASESKEKWIKLTLDCRNNEYIIQIENPGVIGNDIFNYLFEIGVSTKDSLTRGYGLHICKKIIDKYNGDMQVKNTSKQTVLVTIKLPKGVGEYGSKAIS